MVNIETTSHFNVYWFDSSFVDEIVMNLNEADFVSAKIYGDEIEVKSDVLSSEVIGGIYFHLQLGVFSDESKSFRNVGYI